MKRKIKILITSVSVQPECDEWRAKIRTTIQAVVDGDPLGLGGGDARAPIQCTLTWEGPDRVHHCDGLSQHYQRVETVGNPDNWVLYEDGQVVTHRLQRCPQCGVMLRD